MPDIELMGSAGVALLARDTDGMPLGFATIYWAWCDD
jgi:hypothetical protein